MPGRGALGFPAPTPPPTPWLVQIDPRNGVWASSIGTWSFFYEGTALAFVYSGAQNDELNWDVLVSAGTWSLDMLFRGENTRGIATFSLDDGAGSFTTVGTIDTYRASSLNGQGGTIVGISVTGPAVNRRLKMKGATKNASSSGYVLQPVLIQLRRTA